VKSTNSIEIDIDIHKIIEANRDSFSETPNDVLRRLLIGSENVSQPIQNESGLAAWQGKQVTLPHGTKLEMTYNGVTVKADIVSGKWKVGDNLFRSPSAAAGEVGRITTGKTKSLDGWRYWKALLPNEELWQEIRHMRRREEVMALRRQGIPT